MPKIKKRHFLDYGILIPYIILCVLGILMVYSSSSYNQIAQDLKAGDLAINQLIFWILSLIVIGLLYKMKLDVFKNQKMIMIVVGVMCLLLFIVLFMPPINGASGWIQIPGVGSIQPAEYFKIVVVWYLAFTLSRRQESIQDSFVDTVKGPVAVILSLTLLVIIQPDFGNASIITLIMLIMLLSSGVNYMYTLVIGGGGVLLSAGAIWLMLTLGDNIIPSRFHYIYERFASFSNPFADELGNGHQMVNGYYAMFNGGLFGRGLGDSIQKKGFLNEAQTDYIFAIVVEELGLIAAIVILGLLLFMVIKILLVGIRAKDPFNSMMCIGIGSLFLIQIFINLGGICGIIPLTGVTFPFLSQGGSSLLCLSICVGLALNISADEKRKKFMLDES